MMDAAQRAPIRRLFYAAYTAGGSVELGVRYAAIRYAVETGRFIRARLRVRSTRLDPCREPVALILDNQPRPYAMWPFEKCHDTGYLRWVGPRQAYVRRPQPMWVAAVLQSATRPSEQAPPAVDARTTGLCFDLAVEIRVGIHSVYSTVEILTRSARRQHGHHMRGISDIAVLRQWYRRWLASDRN